MDLKPSHVSALTLLLLLLDIINWSNSDNWYSFTPERLMNSQPDAQSPSTASPPVHSTNKDVLTKSSSLQSDFLSKEFGNILTEWGGNCTAAHWRSCSNLIVYSGSYVVKDDPLGKVHKHEIKCNQEPMLCLKNGWTVNRCHILCMSKCNKAMLSKYDDFVEKLGPCQ